MQMIRIETERLILREWEECDFSAVHEYASDQETVRYMIWGPNTEDETRAFLALKEPNRAEIPRLHYELAVTLKESGKVIGGCGLSLEPEYPSEAQIGYILNKNYWRKGYGAEASSALVDWSKRELGLKVLWSTCHPENEASWRLMERIGMKRLGLLPQHIKLRTGKWRDSFVYRMDLKVVDRTV